jgi:uncharacterized metal-binding protein
MNVWFFICHFQGGLGLGFNARDLSSVFCSELIAEALQTMQLLDDHVGVTSVLCLVGCIHTSFFSSQGAEQCLHAG